MSNSFQKGLDKAQDAVGLFTHDQPRRTGISAKRIEKSLDKGVDASVIALQITLNEQRNNPQAPEVFTASEVNAIAKFSRLNKRRIAYTQAQAGELERNQQAVDAELA